MTIKKSFGKFPKVIWFFSPWLMVDNAKTYAFGGFRFVPSESLLMKGHDAIALPPKALHVLEILVEKAGNVVTKDDLIRDVWDDLAIEESAVPRTVFLVRTALGDDAKNSTFIQTVPKRGYRFVADVSTLNGSGGGELIQSAPVAEFPLISTVMPRHFSAVHLVIALLLIASVAAGAYFGFLRATPASSKISLLVMPVTSAESQNVDELLENGIADALIHQLASSKDIQVRPLSATRSYSGKAADPIQAGREQKVNKVLSASYQRADGKLRILARLISIETGETEQDYKFETSGSGIFTVQDAIAKDLGNKIAMRLGGSTGTTRAQGTTNEEAYRQYFNGMTLFDVRNSRKAVESFERAVKLDPNYARAWAGKAVALAAMPSLGDSTSSELYEETIRAAEQALVLDPASAEAYSALCGAKLTYAHDFAGAEEACGKALEISSNSAVALQNYSFLRISQGRPDEGIQAIKAALDIEPTSFFSQAQYTNALYFARRYDEAYAQYVRLSELQPNRLPTYEWIIRNLEASKREREAMEWLVRSLKIRNADDALLARIQDAYQASGWPGVLRERIVIEKDSMNYFRQAGLYARLGNKDAAFELLEKAYVQRVPIFVTLRVEPQFDPLRDDPRYASLVERMQSGSR